MYSSIFVLLVYIILSIKGNITTVGGYLLHCVTLNIGGGNSKFRKEMSCHVSAPFLLLKQLIFPITVGPVENHCCRQRGSSVARVEEANHYGENEWGATHSVPMAESPLLYYKQPMTCFVSPERLFFTHYHGNCHTVKF